MRCSLLLSILVISIFAQDMSQVVNAKNKHNGSYDFKGIKIQSNDLYDFEKDVNITAKRYDIDENLTLKNRSKKYDDEAKAFVDEHFSERVQKNIENQKQVILNDAAIKFEKGKETVIDPVSFTQGFIPNKNLNFSTNSEHHNVQREVMLDKKERIYIYVSTSLPEDVIRHMVLEVKPISHHVIFALKGFVGNIHKLQPSIDFMTKIKKMEGGEHVAIEINPTIDEAFNIERAPCILYIENYDPIMDMNKGIINGSSRHWKVYGAPKVVAALKRIHEMSKSKGLAKCIKALEDKESFYRSSK